MKTIKFNCRGNNAPAYGCNKPGDNSGEYVSADVAEKLYQALDLISLRLQMDIDDGSRPDKRAMEALVCRASEAMAKARGDE